MKTILMAVFAMFASVNAYAACQGRACPLYVNVSVTPQEQMMYVSYYENGRTEMVGYQISSGMEGHQTPNYEGHPLWLAKNDYHDSSIYPEGDYRDPQTGKSLGNMPYAMFFTNRGHAIHGTPVGNFRKIGKAVSHGCIRMYSDQAKWLNRMIRKYGAENTWFSITRSPVGTADGAGGGGLY